MNRTTHAATLLPPFACLARQVRWKYICPSFLLPISGGVAKLRHAATRLLFELNELCRPNDLSWPVCFCLLPQITLPDRRLGAPSQQTSRRPAPASLFVWGIGIQVTHPPPIVMCLGYCTSDIRPVWPGLAAHPWSSPSRRMLSDYQAIFPSSSPACPGNTTAVPELGALQDLAPSLGERGKGMKPPDARRPD